MPIRKPSKKYNSDYMSRKCDEQLEQLEDRLTALYANATNDVLSEYTDWISQYEKQDAVMRAKLDEGKIDENEYLDWRRNKMLNNQQYKETVKSLTDVLVNTDIAAMAMVDGELPLIIAESYNFVQSLGFDAADQAGLSVGTFQVYNARSVQEIVKKNPDLLPVVDVPEDKKWNKDRINREITQGIIKGDSIPKIANRLQGVTNMDKNAAIRNARTAMTGAENLGRNEGFQDLKEKGIPCKLQWSATHDDRTRDTHILLDGTYQDDDGYFGEGIIDTPIQYPGDPAGDPEEVYNCRCRASLRLQGVDHSQDGDLYEKFMKENYPEDWSKVKEQREAKEQAYQENKARAEAKAAEKAEAKSEEQKMEEKPSDQIKYADSFNDEKWNESKKIINELTDEYNTRLQNVNPGAEKHAGDVDMSGTTMRLNKTSPDVAIHEFAHTLANSLADKYGLTHDEEFWKEIKKVRNAYHKDVDKKQDSSRWISTYEHSNKSVDEFLAEAFTQAKMREMGFELPDKYGEDFTYSEQVLEIVDRYFKRK